MDITNQEPKKAIGSAPGVLTDRSGSTQRGIEELEEVIRLWADRVIPDRTPHSALSKMMIEEIPELLNGGLNDPLEWGDVMILLIDSARLHGIDIFQAAFDKMEINEQREWKIDQRGLLKHV